MPAALGRYRNPVPFGPFADLVANRLERVGFAIDAEEYAVDHDGNRLFGLLEVSPIEGEYISAKEWALQVGLRGSHDQSVPRALTLGSRVLVCSNLCFHGDLGVFSTRQTLNVWDRLPGMVESAPARPAVAAAPDFPLVPPGTTTPIYGLTACGMRSACRLRSFGAHAPSPRHSRPPLPPTPTGLRRASCFALPGGQRGSVANCACFSARAAPAPRCDHWRS